MSQGGDRKAPVYLVWEHYYDGLETWKYLISIHSTPEAAELEALRLGCQHIDSGSGVDRSWYTETWEVIGEDDG